MGDTYLGKTIVLTFLWEVFQDIWQRYEFVGFAAFDKYYFEFVFLISHLMFLKTR